MASLQISSLSYLASLQSSLPLLLPIQKCRKTDPIGVSLQKTEIPKAAINGVNGSPQAPKTTRRGRKKGSVTISSSPSAKKPKRSKKTNQDVDDDDVDDLDGYDDGMDFPYESPPLICCFGAAQREFVPTIRISDRQMHPDMYSTWKSLQWDPPEFVRAPGGPPSNVAISHVRLGGRAAFMGKVGDDDFGEELVRVLNTEKVQTRAVKFDPTVMTAVTRMRIGFDGGRMRAETVRESAEDSLLRSEVDVAVLKEVRE